jgi:hypothetical protein
MNPSLPIATALALLVACSRDGTPEQVVAGFHRALAQQDGPKALSLLARETREQLSRRAREAHAASEGAVSDDPARMIIQGDPARSRDALAHGPLETQTRLHAGDTERATVSAVLGTATHDYEVFREDGVWKLALPLEPTEDRAAGGLAP